MSAVSGLTSNKGENKSKQKYQSLNINTLYKGKSLETQKTSVAPKHGLQTLGKVGAGRRMPPPANLPSLKSQTITNPNITLVPTGGQGWGSGKEEDSGVTPPLQTSSVSGQDVSQMPVPKPSVSPTPVPNPLQTSSSGTTVSSVGAIASGLTSAALTAASKTWSTITAIPSEECGPDKSYLAQQSPFFPQEFPKLDGGVVPPDGTIKASVETSYGPGPSLRPQTEGSWGRGTLPQPGFNPNANQQQSAGNGVLGQPASPPLPNDQNIQNIQQISRGLYPAPVSGVPPQRAPLPMNQSGPLMPGQAPLNYPNQYRMVTPYPPHMAYPRGAYPAGAYPPQGYPQSPHGPINTRPPYFPDSRVGQRQDDESGGRPSRPALPIITDKDLKGFDEILDNEVPQSGWAAANTEIDYNAKLVFSDDEDSHAVNDSANYEEIRDRSDSKQKDWDRREYDRERESSHKYRAPQKQYSQQILNERVNNYVLSQQPPPPQVPKGRRSNYSQSQQNRSEPVMADEDEMWRQRSQQQSDEMAAAVIRARQRREEEEKKIEMSRAAAHEKLKALEEKDKSLKERTDSGSIDFDQCSRHSNDSRDEKLSNRDSRDSRSSNFSNSFVAPKQYPKNVPPRFQKQAELMRQTHQQSSGPSAQSPPYDQRLSHSTNRLSSESDPRDLRNIANNSQPPNKAPLIVDSSRSNSQISSGHESYDSERERRTPDYDSKDRRQRLIQSGSESNNWRQMQTQKHPIIEMNDKEFMRLCKEKEEEMNQKLLIKAFKKRNEEIEIQNKIEKTRQEFEENSIKDDINPIKETKETFGDKRTSIERQESLQSSHSDRRNTSSKDDRRRYERLDWAAECDNMVSISNYGPKREHRSHRHVPITQKQFESIVEPIKKNFTPLKKNNSNIGSINEELKENSVNKSKESLKKSETPPPTTQMASYAENVSQSSKNNSSDSPKVQTFRDESRVEIVNKKERELEEQFDKSGVNRENESIKRDFFKEEKNLRKTHSNRYESYSSRGRLTSGPAFRGRGREYRRTRNTSEKSSYNELKLSSSPSNSRNKTNKSRRKSNSDESYVSEDIKRETNKPKDNSNSICGSKDNKPEEDKEKILSSETVMSSSASATVMPSQRSDPSRRGRGVVAFKNSTRGLPRAYGPSNYGPPPFRAAFGDGTANKAELNKHLDQNSNEKIFETKSSNQMRINCSSKSSKDEINYTSYSSSQSNHFHDNRNSISNTRKTGVSGGRSTGNTTASNTSRSEPLPPRFQKRHNKGSQPRGSGGRDGRTRPSNQRSGSSNANHFESDVANNEEWETASESSDVAERGDRKTNRRNNYSSDQRNDSRGYSRKSDNRRGDYPRGQPSNMSGNQSSGTSNYRGGRNRNPGNNDSNSNQQRNGSIGGSNIKENITVCALSDVTLDNPNAVEEALSDIKNRTKASNDLNEEQMNSETEDGFQTVSYKKRNRLNQGNDSKKFKQELSLKSKGTTLRRSQSKLAPRFAKQKENSRLNTISDEAFTSVTKLNEGIKSITIEPKNNEIITKTAKDKIESTVINKAVPNAWSRPLSHCSQTTANSPTVTTTTKSVVKTTNCITHDIQALSVSSKSSSFDQHDSGIDVSDQPQSTASSQRSSPSNEDNKGITTTAKLNSTDVRTDIGVTEMDTAKPMLCTVIFENTRFKEENKVLAKISPPKSPSVKDMFASVSSSTLTNNVVTETSRSTEPITAVKKSDSVLIEEFPINEKNQNSNVAKVVGMQRTSSNVLPTDDLNMNLLKIASVKKVWESPPTLTSTIDSTNDSTKNVLLKTFDKNKIISGENNSNDCHSVKVTKGYQSVSEQTAPKVDYSTVDSISINTLNATKQPMRYSTPTSNQMSSQSYVHNSSHQSQSQPSLISSQILLNTISSPPLTETLRPLSGGHGGHQQFQVHNMATNPAISTPPTMLYNTSQVAAHNVYQAFAPQIESLHQTQLPTVMAQFGPQHTSGHYGQPLLQHQQNALSQANIFMAHQLAQPSAAAEQFKQFSAVAHQQSLAKSLLNNQFVHQNNSTLTQTITNPNSWTTPSGHTQHTSNQTTSYYPQSSSVGAALPTHHSQHFAFQSQPSLGMMSAQSSQAAALVQQSYRANTLTMSRTGGVGVDAANSMAANLRSMFAGNLVNDMKIGTSVNQPLDNRSANRQSFTYTQASNLQQLQQQQQMYANQKFANRAILPIYAQQMLGQAAISGRPNSVGSVLSNVNSANSYTTPIQRPKLNRNNQSYVKSSHPTQHPHQLQTHGVPVPQSQLSTAQQAKMRQEAVRQTQSFFAQSSLPSNKSDSQNESQSCVEVLNESLTKDCLNSDTNEDKNKINSIENND